MKYHYEYYNEEDELNSVELECNCFVHPAEPDVGLNHASAELESCEDEHGVNWGDKLPADVIEEIEDFFLKQGPKETEHVGPIPRRYIDTYRGLL